MSVPRSKGCLILLNGFPGVGKLAIARELKSKLGHVDTRLVDNHLIIDPAEAIHPGRGPKHIALRNQLRQTLLEELKELPNPDTSVIMTVCLGNNEGDAAVFAEHIDIARSRDIPCYAFTIFCEKTEHLLRLQSPDRARGDKKKLADPAILETMLSDNKILDPTDRDAGYELDFDVQLYHRSIDTTALSLGESALRIVDAITLHSSGEQSSTRRCSSEQGEL